MPVKISPEAFVKKDYSNSNLAYKKKCVECGCVYYAKHDRSLYCSRQCNNLYSKRRKKGVMGTKMSQGGIAAKALTTEDEKTPVKAHLSFMNQQIQDATGIDWEEGMAEITRIRNNHSRKKDGFYP